MIGIIRYSDILNNSIHEYLEYLSTNLLHDKSYKFRLSVLSEIIFENLSKIYISEQYNYLIVCLIRNSYISDIDNSLECKPFERYKLRDYNQYYDVCFKAIDKAWKKFYSVYKNDNKIRFITVKKFTETDILNYILNRRSISKLLTFTNNDLFFNSIQSKINHIIYNSKIEKNINVY